MQVPDIKRKKQNKRKFLIGVEAELLEELELAAKHATEVFAAEGAPEVVSRNEWVEYGLQYALAAYWEKVGGKPLPVPSKVKASAKAYAAKRATKVEM